MYKIEFDLTEEEMDLLWAVKEQLGRQDCTGNEFAQGLLVDTLYSIRRQKKNKE